MKQRKKQPSDKEILDFAVWTRLNQYSFLLEEGIDLTEKALIIKYRSLIEDSKDKLPKEIRTKINAVDEWLLDHAEHPMMVKLLTQLTSNPKVIYWWEDIEKLKNEKLKRKTQPK